jgi:hypothetical protein
VLCVEGVAPVSKQKRKAPMGKIVTMAAMNENTEKLRDYLNSKVVPGKVPIGYVGDVERLLCHCWHELEITADDSNLEPYKLINRTESLPWEKPLLSFQIERHGPTVNGSVYAEVHQWLVNLEDGSASLDGKQKRMVGTPDKRVDVKPIAVEIAGLIVAGVEDERLKWDNPEIVRLQIGEIIRETNKQTTSGRRKRFRTELGMLLQEHGWFEERTNKYAKMNEQLFNACEEATEHVLETTECPVAGNISNGWCDHWAKAVHRLFPAAEIHQKHGHYFVVYDEVAYDSDSWFSGGFAVPQ